MKKMLKASPRATAATPRRIRYAQKPQFHVLRDAFPATPAEPPVKDFAARYRISQDMLTRLTGFSLRAVANWSQGSKPSASTVRRLAETRRLLAALERLVSPQAIGPWLKQPNPAFGGSTPLQVIERGEADRLWRMIYELESGGAT